MWQSLPMRLMFAIVLACSSAEETPIASSDAAEEPVAVPIVEAPAPAPSVAGRILGEPILPKATVVGGIDNQVVMDGMEQVMAPINECYSTHALGLAGKLLVRFAISGDGSVAYARTQSTTLRYPVFESCVLESVTQARFPPLDRGRLAVVRYPFSFPPAEPK